MAPKPIARLWPVVRGSTPATPVQGRIGVLTTTLPWAGRQVSGDRHPARGGHSAERVADIVFTAGSVGWLGLAVLSYTVPEQERRSDALRPGPVALSVSIVLAGAAIVQVLVSDVVADRRLHVPLAGQSIPFLVTPQRPGRNLVHFPEHVADGVRVRAPPVLPYRRRPGPERTGRGTWGRSGSSCWARRAGADPVSAYAPAQVEVMKMEMPGMPGMKMHGSPAAGQWNPRGTVVAISNPL